MRRGVAAAACLVFAGCATPGARQAQAPAAPPAPCRFDTCGADAASLKRLTAKQLGAGVEQVSIVESQNQFGGAVLVWRATADSKTYDCREGRDPQTGAVHYLDCHPSGGGPLKAFQ